MRSGALRAAEGEDRAGLASGAHHGLIHQLPKVGADLLAWERPELLDLGVVAEDQDGDHEPRHLRMRLVPAAVLRAPTRLRRAASITASPELKVMMTVMIVIWMCRVIDLDDRALHGFVIRCVGRE